MKILLDGEPYAVIENEFVKPGKGQAFNRIKVRNLKNGRVIERTFRSGESLEAADVVDTEMQYLYQDGEFWHFMVPENFEQYTAGKAAVGDNAQWLKDGMSLHRHAVEQRAAGGRRRRRTSSSRSSRPIRACAATPPPAVRSRRSSRPARSVRVPLFINEGEVIRVDTRTGEYISRAKQ